ncbi:MAG: RNA polymerase sigma-70 factor [Prevotella sp.]
MDFSELYVRYYPLLVTFASRYVDPDDAKDMVQDTLMTIWEKLDTLAFVSDLPSYIYTSVKNKCLDHVRHQKYCQEYYRKELRAYCGMVKMDMLSNNSCVQSELELKELEQHLDKVVNELPARCRKIFMMSRDEGMPNKEISQTLGLSVNTVECQMGIALRRLRATLMVS